MRYINEIPVNNFILSRAMDILNDNGFESFKRYANQYDFSYVDRNHVIERCRVIYNRNDIKPLPILESLKNERWEYYTKKLGYGPHKAHELLERIDKTYANYKHNPKFDQKTILSDIG